MLADLMASAKTPEMNMEKVSEIMLKIDEAVAMARQQKTGAGIRAPELL